MKHAVLCFVLCVRRHSRTRGIGGQRERSNVNRRDFIRQVCLIGAWPQANRVPKGSLAAVERLQGIKEALSAAGVEMAGAIACPDWQPELGYSATRRLLERTRPSALICFNDRLAFGAYQALAEAGLTVPTDVSVVSFDDDVLASWVKPQLTTVALPHYELGRATIQLLLDRRQSQSHYGHPRIQRIRCHCESANPYEASPVGALASAERSAVGRQPSSSKLGWRAARASVVLESRAQGADGGLQRLPQRRALARVKAGEHHVLHLVDGVLARGEDTPDLSW